HFYMRTKASTKVLDVAADTGNVALWGDNTGTDEVSSAARAFEILKINLDYSNWYLNYGTEEIVYIRNVDSGKLMTGKSDLDVYFGDALYTDDQKWKLLRRPDGSYEFVHLATGKYLDVSQGDIASGTTVNLWDCNGHRAQGFYILPSDVEDYVLIKPCYSENVLDMGAGVGDLAIYPPRLDLEVPRAAQIFEIVFEKIEGNTVPAENLGNEFEAYVVDKLYKQAFTDMGNMVLESHQFTQADNQLFKFYYDASTNSYEIVGNSGKALDVTMTGYRDGDVVGLYDRNNWVAQRFRLHKVGEYYAISPIYTNKLLDLHADNKTTIQLCGATRNDHRLFELVFKATEDTLVLKDSSSYSKDGTDLYKVASGQTASGLLGNFDNESAEVWNTNGTKVTGTAKVGTGYTVNLIINGQKLDSVTVIINGDVTGDGVVDATDYLRIKGIFLETYKASGAYAKAADVDGTGKTDSTDYLRVKGHFLETYNLYK
ncbi:MAG: RICIN domain-containing protein, partial [Clostridia bacterium]|nr:RICIN domain-containing protein [Clostridia bacterium]